MAFFRHLEGATTATRKVIFCFEVPPYRSTSPPNIIPQLEKKIADRPLNGSTDLNKCTVFDKRTFQFEDAATDVADDITKPRPAEEEDVQRIQILLNSDEVTTGIRTIKVSFVVTFAGVYIVYVQSRECNVQGWTAKALREHMKQHKI